MYFDTIYAISSGEIKSGVVVFRISGRDAFKVIDIFLIENLSLSIIKPRFAYLRELYSIDNQNINLEFLNLLKEDKKISKYPIDKVLLLFFKAPNSFTGENIVEIHAHGSLAVMKMISLQLSKFFRHAKPGEFTKTALFNNKISVYEVESLQTLLAAETIMQHQLSLTQKNPKVEQQHLNWRGKLINALAYAEACIDFSDEDDIPIDLISNVVDIIINIKVEIEKGIEQMSYIEKIKTGINTAIIGKPNSGKSSLINLLAKKQVAIVSGIPGTTRDAIEVCIDIMGNQVNIIDTAGIRNVPSDILDNEVEKIGIDIAKNLFLSSDIKIILISIDDFDQVFLEDIFAILKQFYIDDLALQLQLSQIIFVFNKIDLFDDNNFINDESFAIINFNNIKEDIDAPLNIGKANVNNTNKTNENTNDKTNKNVSNNINEKISKNIKFNNKINSYLNKIKEIFANKLNISTLNNLESMLENKLYPKKIITQNDNIEPENDNINPTIIFISSKNEINIDLLIKNIAKKCKNFIPKENPIITSARQREYFMHTIFYLDQALNSKNNLVFLAENIRQAIKSFEPIIGKINTEDLLDKIFADFCIGK